MEFLSSRTLVVDTSVLIAVVMREEGFERFSSLLKSSSDLFLSSASYVELFVVAFRRLDSARVADIDALLRELRVEVVPFNREHASLAREAYRRFGKGRHPAALNFGDCFSYALAKHLNEPLLFKGEDFRQTDVLIA